VYKDWLDAVNDGDTKLGFADWCVIQRQIEGEDIEDTPSLDTSFYVHEMDVDD
jgi:hypothetical protein